MIESKENYKCDLGAKGFISSLNESGEKGEGGGEMWVRERGGQFQYYTGSL